MISVPFELSTCNPLPPEPAPALIEHPLILFVNDVTPPLRRRSSFRRTAKRLMIQTDVLLLQDPLDHPFLFPGCPNRRHPCIMLFWERLIL